MYPDVVESGAGRGFVKSHHNGVCRKMDFRFRAALAFKDEVRVGQILGLPDELVWQPFPGPVYGESYWGGYPCKVAAQNADYILRDEITWAGWRDIWQWFCRADRHPPSACRISGGLTATCGHQGCEQRRRYDCTVQLPYHVLEKISSWIIEVKTTRVVYDIFQTAGHH